MRSHLIGLILGLSIAASCSSGPSVDRATIANFDYFVPSGWADRQLSTLQRGIVEWTPPDNEHAKESITVIRVELPAIAKGGTAYIERLLAHAQQSLPNARFASPVRFRTPNGLAGARIEGDFIPSSHTERYQRIHAVLISGSSLLHVVYTSRVADRESFEIVVNSFSNRGA